MQSCPKTGNVLQMQSCPEPDIMVQYQAIMYHSQRSFTIHHLLIILVKFV